MDLEKEKLNLEYREVDLNLKHIFPNFKNLENEFNNLKNENPHITILNVIKFLWEEGYSKIMDKYGFYEKEFCTFSGHCHQCSPIFALVLKSLGFNDIYYLECFRAKESILNGIIEKVDPNEEPNPAMREEFSKINRIPYCCIELNVEGKKFYISPKHIKPKDNNFTALLKPECYLEFTGILKHQDDKNKSGIYLKNILPNSNPNNIDFNKRIVWTKETYNDPKPEYFIAYLRMKL